MVIHIEYFNRSTKYVSTYSYLCREVKGSQKHIYNIKPKLRYRAIYNKNPNNMIDIAIVEN